MKYFTLLCLLMAALHTSAQGPDDLWKNRCDFKTDGSAKSKGLQIKFSVPCKWEEEKSKKEDIIKSLQYEVDDDNGIVATIAIKKPEKKMTPEKMDEIISKDAELKDKNAKRMWARKLKIDGMDCLEVAIKAKKSVMMISVNIYTVLYTIPKGDYSVQVSYAIIGKEEAQVKARFNEYKTLFYNLANATDFLN